MPDPAATIYQVRHLTDDDVPGERTDTIECKDSAEAMQTAWSLMEAHGVEVWCGKRFVGRLEPPASDRSMPEPAVLLEGIGTVLDRQVSLGSIAYAISVFPSPIGPRTLAKGELKGDPAGISRLIEGGLYHLVFADGALMSFVVVGLDTDKGTVRIRANGTVPQPGDPKKSDRGPW